MQQTHPVFGELVHYGSEPFINYIHVPKMDGSSKSM